MKSIFKRVAVAAMLAVTVMLITMPLGQAASNPVPVPPSGIHQDLSTQAGIDAYFSLTVAGIPVGAVLAVLGISYGMYTFLADQLFQARGYYTWGAWVCL